MEIIVNSKIEISDADLLVYFGSALIDGDVTNVYYIIANDLGVDLKNIAKNSKKEIKDRLINLLNNEINKLDNDEEISN